VHGGVADIRICLLQNVMQIFGGDVFLCGKELREDNLPLPGIAQTLLLHIIKKNAFCPRGIHRGKPRIVVDVSYQYQIAIAVVKSFFHNVLESQNQRTQPDQYKKKNEDEDCQGIEEDAVKKECQSLC
jgi:hypothetical protein